MFPEGWKKWRHMVKMDPDKPADEKLVEEVVKSGTDAVIIGGTQNITREKVSKLCRLLRPYPIPRILEVSSLDSITLGFDGYLIPVVLNAGDVRWIVGAHQRAVRTAGEFIEWDELLPEGYIILNPSCAAAKLTDAVNPLTKQDALAYARCGENLFSLPVIYLEYSGCYGDPELVAFVKEGLKKSRLFYGGGIDDAEKAAEMGSVADTIIVGNMIYTGDVKKLKETVMAVKN
jgi:putative glycerol-1-phosphate prenyltransferase